MPHDSVGFFFFYSNNVKYILSVQALPHELDPLTLLRTSGPLFFTALIHFIDFCEHLFMHSFL